MKKKVKPQAKQLSAHNRLVFSSIKFMVDSLKPGASLLGWANLNIFQFLSDVGDMQLVMSK